MTFKAALLAGAIGLALTAGTASAQSYYNDTSYAPSETVTVQAPRIYVQPGHNLGQPGKVSLSENVPYDDLDLTTYDGARELKVRVADSARSICDRLEDNLGPQQPGTSCYRGALQDGMRHADEAIRNARSDYRYSRY